MDSIVAKLPKVDGCCDVWVLQPGCGKSNWRVGLIIYQFINVIHLFNFQINRRGHTPRPCPWCPSQGKGAWLIALDGTTMVVVVGGTMVVVVTLATSSPSTFAHNIEYCNICSCIEYCNILAMIHSPSTFAVPSTLFGNNVLFLQLNIFPQLNIFHGKPRGCL